MSKLLINMARELDYYKARCASLGIGEGYAMSVLADEIEKSKSRLTNVSPVSLAWIRIYGEWQGFHRT